MINKKGIKYSTELIEVGDYLLPDGVAIERKKGNDLMASVNNNRLYEQLNNLCNYEHPILCIICDNIWRDFYFSGSRYIHKSYLGTLTTLSLSYPKLKLVFLESDDMFGEFMASLYVKVNRDGKSSRPAPMMRRAKKIQTRMEDSLTCIQGVGVPMSKKILKEFNTLKNVANAKVEDLSKIDKVGKKKAENIYNLYNQPYKNNRKKKN